MADRLIASMRRVYRILKSGNLTGNLIIVAKLRVQPRYSSELRSFRVYLSHKSPRKSALKAPNHDSKSGGNGNGGGDGKKNSSGRVVDQKNAVETVLALYILNAFVLSMFINFRSHNQRKSYEEITLKDFVDNYLNRGGRVVKHEFLGKKWIQFQTESADGTKTLRVRIDSLDFYEVAYLLATLSKNAQRQMKAEPENDLPVKDQDQTINVFPGARFVVIVEGVGRRIYEKLQQNGKKARGLLISGLLMAYKRIISK